MKHLVSLGSFPERLEGCAPWVCGQKWLLVMPGWVEKWNEPRVGFDRCRSRPIGRIPGSFRVNTFIPWKSKDLFFGMFVSVNTFVLVGIYTQQFQGTMILMVFDFQAIHFLKQYIVR